MAVLVVQRLQEWNIHFAILCRAHHHSSPRLRLLRPKTVSLYWIGPRHTVQMSKLASRHRCSIEGISVTCRDLHVGNEVWAAIVTELVHSEVQGLRCTSPGRRRLLRDVGSGHLHAHAHGWALGRSGLVEIC